MNENKVLSTCEFLIFMALSSMTGMITGCGQDDVLETPEAWATVDPSMQGADMSGDASGGQGISPRDLGVILDAASEPDSSPPATCGRDEHVLNQKCVPCAWGLTREPGDLVQGLDTQCQGIIELSSGSNYTCILEASGDLTCWGQGPHRLAEFEDDKSTPKAEDTLVPMRIMEGVTSMGVSDHQLCTVNAERAMTCFQRDSDVDLRDPWSLSKPTLTMDNITSVSVGKEHACAVSLEGTLTCWGHNDHGQLGQGDYATYGELVTVPGEYKSASTGSFHTCAITMNDELMCWGRNLFGEVGLKQGISQNSPYKVLSNVKQVSAGFYGATCAVTHDDELHCWGTTWPGTYLMPPSDVMLTQVERVSVGHSHICSVMRSGELKCWGSNTYGSVGNGTAQVVDTPETVWEQVIHVASGEDHTCASSRSGELRCWGENTRGQLGLGTTSSSKFTPEWVMSDVVHVSARDERTCVITGEQELKCWGGRDFSDPEQENSPVNAGQPHTIMAQMSYVSVGHSHACGVTTSRVALCWGSNQKGQVGRDDMSASELPYQVLDEVALIKSGLDTTCAITFDNELKCWGHAPTIKEYTIWTTPQHVLDNVRDVSIGRGHICAITLSDQLYCTGNNVAGQVGHDITESIYEPQLIMDNVAEISLFHHSSCAVTHAGALFCWGSIYPFVSADTFESFEPLLIEPDDIRDVSFGFGHLCTVRRDNKVQCHGYNSQGEVGNGSSDFLVRTPQTVFEQAASIALGHAHSCALSLDGELYCWGSNVEGQINASNKPYSPLPLDYQAADESP